jgi:hypothetical protein
MASPLLLLPAAGKLGRFSTIVEISVENSGLSGLAVMKTLEVSRFAYGEGPRAAFFTLFFALSG